MRGVHVFPDEPSKLDELLHPAQAFSHPSEVVSDPDLSLNEKRAILASWASDACAVEAAPGLRCPPGGKRPIDIDEILCALRSLDKEAQGGAARYRHRPIRGSGRSDPGGRQPRLN